MMSHPFSTTLHRGIVQTGLSVTPERIKTAHTQADQTDFHEQLQKSLNRTLTFSAHASDRLKQRNITLSKGDLDTLNHAVSNVAQKGGRESLIFFKDTAFVVSVPNRTVITAIDGSSMSDHVFTKIDSALFVNEG
jgi:flagellar operon protein